MLCARNRLETIFSRSRVSDDDETLAAYACDQSFAGRRMPDFVVFAESVDEVQQLLRLANETLTPIIPYSSGLNFHGAAIPDHGGIILNLSRMNKILKIDEHNWYVIVEPGVTYEQLQAELQKRGFRVMVPFGISPKRSALSSYLERDPVLAAPSFEYGNFLIMDTEIVLPDGVLFRTGQWASAGEPGGPMGPVRNSLFRMWTGAQGTLGIMTKMGMQITPLIAARKLFFIQFNELTQAIEPLQAIQKREIGMECFLLNRFNLAALISTEWQVPDAFPAQPVSSESFEYYRTTLPAWTMIVCLQGGMMFPEEKIVYEEQALRETCSSLGVEVHESFPSCNGLDRLLLDELLHPWGILKKFNYRGSVHDLNFKSPIQQIARMEAVIKEVCTSGGYAAADIGGYLLPLERGRAVHCEFDLHCNHADARETAQVKDIWLRASEDLITAGAFFDRPYGIWADMLYKRCGTYTEKLRELKKELDPNNILNPGKLCFQ